MRKRKRLLILPGLLAAALFIGAGLQLFWDSSPPPRFTAALADRIHQGMTEAEVVAVLGMPAGDYHTTEIYLRAPDDYRSKVWIKPEGLRGPDGITEKAWISNEGGVTVEFDSEGRVCRSYWEGYWTPKPQSWFDSIRRWLRGLWP